MPETRGNKRSYICISSSSCGDEEEEPSESESEEYDGNDDDDCDEMSASTSCDDDDDDDEEESDGDDDEEQSDGDDDEEQSDDEGDESDEENDGESANLDDEEYRCNSVILLLRERSDLQELNLKDCRAYLRKHGLRITGTKVECIQRIMEHWRIKDGNAEALYPRSSFTINCTGDVCKGDAVLFVQKVYKKFDKVARSGTLIGKRTVAGRVVKESYGAAKQQHTFTIEVLWSKGIKKLLALCPLLVKGRNLYKLKTFRQRWKNETEREKVLAEKHKRGAAARLVRAKMKTRKAYPKNGGVKRQKHFHPTGKKAEEKGEHAKRRGKTPMEHAKSRNHRQKAPPVARANLKISYSNRPKSSRNHQKNSHPKQYGDVTARTSFPQNFHQSQIPHQWSAPFHFPPRMGFPHFRPYMDSSVVPSSQIQGSNHGFYSHQAYSYPNRLFEPRNLNPSPKAANSYELSKPFY